jgi:two-component system cell cycle sensor histidine kinase/response regulator CckA
VSGSGAPPEVSRGIPLANSSRVAAAGPPETASDAGGDERATVRPTILVVEDEDAVRRITCTILRRSGYTVIEAASPRLACEMFHTQGEGVDLLLTDVVMPGMNGPSLAQRLIAERPGLRVLFMSGYVDIGLSLEGQPDVALLNKPFQSSTLLAKVQDVLTRPRTTP